MRLHSLWLLPFVFALGSCVPVTDPANQKNVEKVADVSMVDYGNGVYYLKAEGAEFGNALSFLSAKYPGQVITWDAGSINKDGKILGYFIRITDLKSCTDKAAE